LSQWLPVRLLLPSVDPVPSVAELVTQPGVPVGPATESNETFDILLTVFHYVSQ
jgi:hypothetical protein